MAGRVQDRVALVTGGSSGIGRAAAERLAQEGALVVITDLQDAKGADVVAAIQAMGGRAEYHHHDVTQEQAWIDVMAAIKARHGRLDVLVNNAGIGISASVLDMSLADFQRQTAINVDGVFLGCKHGIPLMRVSGAGGSIINISTAWAFEPSAMFPTSAVFRAGLASYTKIFSDDFAPKNVRMNNILPGWIDSLPATEARRQSVPMGRYGRAEEIAATVAFLASDGGGYITGQNLRVDGGITRSV